MPNIRPSQLILRCYGYKTKEGKWFGLCLDFNIAAEADSPEEMKQKMKEFIESYIETILDTDDKGSISNLFSRRAPIHDWLIYYLIKTIFFIKQFPGKFIFKEFIPIHLAHNC
jgi:predicted RNase H-like HicB family nuclease